MPHRYIPSSARRQADVWKALKMSTGIAFYSLWALGIGEAIWHHQSEVVTEYQETVTPKLSIFPTQGGMGAGFTLSF